MISVKLLAGLAATARWLALGLMLLLVFSAPIARAADAPRQGDGVQVMEAFERQLEQTEEKRGVSEQNKRLIMFGLGVPLLILILITAALGIAMGVYGKQVFVMHTVFAGLTVTLALVHVVVALVWFNPF